MINKHTHITCYNYILIKYKSPEARTTVGLIESMVTLQNSFNSDILDGSLKILICISDI